MIAVAATALVLAGVPADRQVIFPRTIGSFTYYVNGKYKHAVGAFGRPTYKRTTSAVNCRVGWASKGLRIDFRSPAHPCRASSLREAEYSGATFVSRRWSIDRGLRVRDSWERMRKLYPLSEQVDRFNKHKWRVRQAVSVQPGTMHKRRAFIDALFRNRHIVRIDIGYEYGTFTR